MQPQRYIKQFALLVCSLTTATAIPLKDVHQTSMDLVQTAPSPTALDQIGGQGYVLTIERTDELMDEKTQLVEATRLHRVQLQFDVEGGEVVCNGIQIPSGISNMKVGLSCMCVCLLMCPRSFCPDDVQSLTLPFP